MGTTLAGPDTARDAMNWYGHFIERVAGIQGGEPVIKGTRTPVRTIVGYAKAYHGNLNEVHEALPHLRPEEIEAALAYYREHTDEIDGLVERHQEALKQVRVA